MINRLLILLIVITLSRLASANAEEKAIQCIKTLNYNNGSRKVDICNLVYTAYENAFMHLGPDLDEEIAKLLPDFKAIQQRKKDLKNRYDIQEKTLISYKQILENKVNLFGITKYNKQEIEAALAKLKNGEAKPSDYEFDGGFRVYFTNYKDYHQYASETTEIEKDINDPKWTEMADRIGFLQLKSELTHKMYTELGVHTDFVKDFYIKSFDKIIKENADHRNTHNTKSITTKKELEAFEKEQCSKGVGIGCEKNIKPNTPEAQEFGENKKRFDKAKADEKHEQELSDEKYYDANQYMENLTAKEWPIRKEDILKKLHSK